MTTVAIMAGGDSSEWEISIDGAKNIYSILNRKKYIPYIVRVKDFVWSVQIPNIGETLVDKNDFSFTYNGEKIKFDYALILVHGTPGENGLLPAYFEMAKIPHSTCLSAAGVVTFDKRVCKRVVAPTAVPLAKDITVCKGDEIDKKHIIDEIGLPMFVKPVTSGSSFGVSKVKSAEELDNAIKEALKEGDVVMFEEFIEGTEISCGIMMLNGETTLFPPTEIVSKTEFFDYKAKYEGLSDEITPARISKQALECVYDAMVKVYKVTECRGLVRIDFIIKNDIPYMIEINTIPGMGGESIIPREAKVMGVPLADIFSRIIEATK